MDTPDRRADRIPSLDGLRAVAITLVLIGHACGTLPAVRGTFAHAYADWLAEFGVQLFFVLSGYLITRLLTREQQQTGQVSLGAFYARRAVRILPPFWAYLIVILVLRGLGVVPTPLDVIASAAACLQNYSHLWTHPTHAEVWYVGHFWSLSLEEQFYFVWPAAFLALGRHAAKLAAGLVLLIPCVRLGSYFALPESREYLGIMAHTAADPIMFGCLLALVEPAAWFARLRERIERPTLAFAAAVFLLGVSPLLATVFGGVYAYTVGTGLNAVAVGGLLIATTRGKAGPLMQLLNAPLVVHLGVISYSLYLWQQLFLTPLTASWLGAFPWNVVAALAAAEASYRLIERPFAGLRHRFRRVTPTEAG